MRLLLPADWPMVKAIFESGISTGNATFEASAPDWATWDVAHLPHVRFVAAQSAEICGWAALSAVSKRRVYAGVAEVSVYVAERHQHKGIGQLLLEKLIIESEQAGFWTLQAGIFPENEASLHLHKKVGFRVVGYREKIGQMNGVWRDNVLLERRSKIQN